MLRVELGHEGLEAVAPACGDARRCILCLGCLAETQREVGAIRDQAKHCGDIGDPDAGAPREQLLGGESSGHEGRVFRSDGGMVILAG